MKTTNMLRSAALATLSSVILFSCSKDALQTPRADAATSNTESERRREPVEGVGQVQAVIYPAEAKFYVTVMSETFKSFKVFPNDKGYVLIEKVPAGTYIFTIHPSDPYQEVQIDDIKVVADETTDLGEIVLQ